MSAPAIAQTRPGSLSRPAVARERRATQVLARIVHSRSAVVGGSLLLLVILAALAAPLISPYDPIKTNQRLSLEAPSLAHLMGTDRFGRDIFSRPGVGRLAVDAILNRDFPLVQGTVLFAAATYVLVNLAVDVSYAIIDPRIRYR